MSEDSVAVVTRWYDALQAGDPAPELCHPEIEITNWAEFPVRGPYRGHGKILSAIGYPSPRETRRAAGLD